MSLLTCWTRYTRSFARALVAWRGFTNMKREVHYQRQKSRGRRQEGRERRTALITQYEASQTCPCSRTV